MFLNTEINEYETKRSIPDKGQSDNEAVRICETHLAFVDWYGI